MKLIAFLLSAITATAQTWTFDTATATNGLSVNIGNYSTGWHQSSDLGTAAGWFDMGQFGSVGAPVTGPAKIYLSVWVDGNIYPVPQISVTGATQTSYAISTNPVSGLGAWQTVVTEWSGAGTLTITQTDPHKSFLIDSLTIENQSLTVGITKTDAITVTWPAGTILQESTNGVTWADSAVNQSSGSALIQLKQNTMYRARK